MIYSRLLIKILNFLDYCQQKKIIDLIKKKFSKKIIVADVGAHHGETIKLFNKKLSLKKIYSFEASPVNYKILKKNLHKYNLDIIQIYNFALSDKKSNSYIHQTIESSSSTMNKLNINSKYFLRKLKILNLKKNQKYVKKIPVKVLTLDYFIKKHKIKKIDLLKIDTEGYEFKILKGLNKYIKHVNLIYFEHHYDDMIIKNYKFGQIHDFLKKKGFKMIKKSKMIFRKSFEYVYENQN